MPYPDPAKPLAEQDPVVLLADTVWAEARGEGPLGQAAVAHTVCNRMRQKGQTVAQVVLKRWAFSCYNSPANGGIPLEKLLDPIKFSSKVEWAACLKAATEALEGVSADPTNGATHYCVNALWGCPVAANKFGRRIPKWHDIVEISRGTTVLCVKIRNHTFAKAPW